MIFRLQEVLVQDWVRMVARALVFQRAPEKVTSKFVGVVAKHAISVGNLNANASAPALKNLVGIASC